MASDRFVQLPGRLFQKVDDLENEDNDVSKLLDSKSQSCNDFALTEEETNTLKEIDESNRKIHSKLKKYSDAQSANEGKYNQITQCRNPSLESDLKSYFKKTNINYGSDIICIINKVKKTVTITFKDCDNKEGLENSFKNLLMSDKKPKIEKQTVPENRISVCFRLRQLDTVLSNLGTVHHQIKRRKVT